MKFQPQHIYHIYNQGNNRQVIFHCDEDYIIFLKMIKQQISPHAEILAWCLMPNHFHLLIYTDERSCVPVKQGGLDIDKLTNGIRKLLSGYARINNKRYNRTGSLFRQKTKAKIIDEEELVVKGCYSLADYCSNCFWYIHQNPVSAGLVSNLGEWIYSSWLDYAGLRQGDLCNKELATKFCGYDKRDFKMSEEKNIEDDWIAGFED